MIKIIIVIAVLVLIIHHIFPLVNVIGDSMFPTYLDGEILLGTRIFNKSKLKVGDVIVYKSPTDDTRMVIKRISEIVTDNRNYLFFYCLGDNREHSYDSRDYGYVSSKNLVCKVFSQRKDKNHVNNQE